MDQKTQLLQPLPYFEMKHEGKDEKQFHRIPCYLSRFMQMHAWKENRSDAIWCYISLGDKAGCFLIDTAVP